MLPGTLVPLTPEPRAISMAGTERRRILRRSLAIGLAARQCTSQVDTRETYPFRLEETLRFSDILCQSIRTPGQGAVS